MYLKQIEDPVTGAILKTFVPEMPVGEQGWQARNATFTVGNIDFGASPYGNFAAPMQPRKWPYQVRAVGFRGYDVALDALNAAVGLRTPVRLVATHDLGYERVCENAVAYRVTAPFSVDSTYSYDFSVEWELNNFWSERSPVDNTLRSGQGHRSGEVPTIRSGQGASTTAINAATFPVPTSMVDASVAGPGGIPNQYDTGPVFTIVGPYGGSLGFSLYNLSDVQYGSYFNFLGSVSAGWTLTIDCGAWSAVYQQGTTTVDRTDLLSVPNTQDWIMAIRPGVANQLRMVVNGTYPTQIGAASTTVTDNPLPSASAVVDVTSTTGFLTSGWLLIGSEIISYTGVSGGNQFTGVTRGVSGSAAASHVVSSVVTQVMPPFGAGTTFNTRWRRLWA